MEKNEPGLAECVLLYILIIDSMVVMMICTIDKTSATPESRQVETNIRDRLLAGKIAAGSPLPSPASLARRLQVPKSVVERAYIRLIDEGLLQVTTRGLTVRSDNHSTANGTPESRLALIDHTPGTQPLIDMAFRLPDAEQNTDARMHLYTDASNSAVYIVWISGGTEDKAQDCAGFCNAWLLEEEAMTAEPHALLSSLNQQLFESFGSGTQPVNAFAMRIDTLNQRITLAQAGEVGWCSASGRCRGSEFIPALGEVPLYEYQPQQVAADAPFVLSESSLFTCQNERNEHFETAELPAALESSAESCASGVLDSVISRYESHSGRSLGNNKMILVVDGPHQHGKG